MPEKSKIIVVGDVKVSSGISGLYLDGTITNDEVLRELQNFMLKYGVVKIDVCLDPFAKDHFK